MPKRTIKDNDILGKSLLIRLDFNVPLDLQGKITYHARIVKSLPTIQYAMGKALRMILMSHLGRPEGNPNPKYSLAPVALHLSKLLKAPVQFLEDCVGPQIEERVSEFTQGEIVLLENLPFYPEEDKNDSKFAQALSRLGEIYVNDAFGTAHRAHASTEGVTHFLPSTAGLLLANGARINDTAKDGISVLMVAVMRGHAKFAEFLLGVGADANIDTAGYTALHWAAGKWESIQTHDYPDPRDAEWAYLGGVPAGRLELILALLAHGADINARMTKGAPRYGMSLNFTQLPGATPFWLAAYATDLEVMGLLLANGADPTIPLRNGTTAVMAAAGLGREPGGSLITDEQSVPAVGLCLDLGIDVNAATTAGDTALHGTAYYGNEKVAQLLVARGADVNPKNKKGETPTKVADGYIQAAMVYTRPGVAAALRKLGGKTD